VEEGCDVAWDWAFAELPLRHGRACVAAVEGAVEEVGELLLRPLFALAAFLEVGAGHARAVTLEVTAWTRSSWRIASQMSETSRVASSWSTVSSSSSTTARPRQACGPGFSGAATGARWWGQTRTPRSKNCPTRSGSQPHRYRKELTSANRTPSAATRAACHGRRGVRRAEEAAAAAAASSARDRQGEQVPPPPPPASRRAARRFRRGRVPLAAAPG